MRKCPKGSEGNAAKMMVGLTRGTDPVTPLHQGHDGQKQRMVTRGEVTATIFCR